MKRFFFLFIFILFEFFSVAQGHTCKQDYFPVQNPKNRKWGYMNLLGEWVVLSQYTKTFSFRGNVAIVQKGLAYGAINCELKSLIPPIYDEIKPFVGRSGWVRKGSYWGLINDLGEMLLKPVYTEIRELDHYSSQVWVKTKENLWGLYSKQESKWIVEPRYNQVKVLNQFYSTVELENKKGFVNNNTGAISVEVNLDKIIRLVPYVSVVKRNNKWGIISDNAEFIVPIDCDSIFKFSSTRLVVVKDSLKYLVISRTGEISSKIYSEINPLMRGAAIVKDKKGLFGYINARGNEFIKPKYISANPFQSLRAIVTDLHGSNIINPKGEKILSDSLLYSKIISFDNSNHFLVSSSFLSFNLIDKDGKVHLNGISEHNLSSVPIRLKSDGLWFFYNTKIHEKHKHSFDELRKGVDGYAVAKNGLNFYIYDYNKEVLSKPFPETISTSLSGCFIVKTKFGVSLWVNKKIGENVYDDLFELQPSFFKYKKKKSYGLLNSSGKEITGAKYLNIHFISDELIAAKTKKDVTVLRKNGSVFFQNNDIDNVLGYREGYFVVQKNNLFFFMNKSGKYNFSTGYEKLSILYSGKAAFYKKGKWGLINKKGSIITPPEYSNYKVKNNEIILY